MKLTDAYYVRFFKPHVPDLVEADQFENHARQNEQA